MGNPAGWMNPRGHLSLSHPAELNLPIWQPPTLLMAVNAADSAFKGNNCKTLFAVVTNQNNAGGRGQRAKKTLGWKDSKKPTKDKLLWSDSGMRGGAVGTTSFR